jgi:uncharacterized protein (DUF1015 family)
MAEVIPFKGVLYNPSRVDPGSVMAPPYDIVTPELKEELYSRSRHNIIRIDFGKDSDGDDKNENRYTRASRFLSDWLHQGILIQDRDPSFYCYEISYDIQGHRKKTIGYLGAVKIEDPDTGRIHPHEMTYSKPKSDRLNILKLCNSNTSPIFSLYSSRERTASRILNNTVKKEPFLQAEDGQGFLHRLWGIKDPVSIETIKRELSDKDIFIADGHHRYETAFTFKSEMDRKSPGASGKAPYNYVLMFLSNMEDEGLTLLPTHRLVEIDSEINTKELLRKHFTVEKIHSEGASEEKIRRLMLEKMRDKVHSFGMFLTNANTYYVMSFNDTELKADLPECLKKLDVTVLHGFIFQKLLKIEHIEYEMNPDTAIERARKGPFEAVFFLNPTRIRDVREVALAGLRMPPKSTYFYPKLLTGIVIYKF